MLIRATSLLPFGAAALSVILVVLALQTRKPWGKVVAFFVLLNGATMLWSFCYGIELNLNTSVALDVAPIGSPRYLLYVVEIVGFAATPTYWFLFAAARANKTRWVNGWRLWAAHVPLAYSIAISTTNPITQLFVRQDGPGAPVTYGPLAYPYMLATYSLVILGLYLLVSTSWRLGTLAGRRQALVFGLATSLPLLGGLRGGCAYLSGFRSTRIPFRPYSLF